MKNKENDDLKQFIPLVDAIAETFGSNCEVVLHDLRNLDKAIIKIANGHITGRQVGAPITDMGLRLFEEEKADKKDTAVIGYRTRAKDGRELKSTTVFIKDKKDNTIGCLCINIDLMPYLATKNLIEQICKITNVDKTGPESESLEKFVSDVDSLMGQLIEKAMKEVNKPLGAMSKEDKLQVMRNLKKSGFYQIRGSIRRLSREWGVSLPTIYKYMEEI
jgi:predicted transcriptional regulator YheO